MKKRYLALIFLAVFMLVMSVVFFASGNGEPAQWLSAAGTSEDLSLQEKEREKDMERFEAVYSAYTEELNQFMDSFMDLTYNCDYQERHYYDGAEAYMTKECYSYYVPMEEPEKAGEGGDAFAPYVSHLKGAQYYYAFLTAEQTECLAVVQYSASDSDADVQERLMLLSLIRKEEGWKISRIDILKQ